MKKVKETKPRYPLFNSMHDIINFVADSYGDNVLYKYYVGKEIREVSFNRYKDWFMGIGTPAKVKRLATLLSYLTVS